MKGGAPTIIPLTQGLGRSFTALYLICMTGVFISITGVCRSASNQLSASNFYNICYLQNLAMGEDGFGRLCIAHVSLQSTAERTEYEPEHTNPHAILTSRSDRDQFFWG